MYGDRCLFGMLCGISLLGNMYNSYPGPFTFASIWFVLTLGRHGRVSRRRSLRNRRLLQRTQVTFKLMCVLPEANPTT
jgi:hypothetical protein